MTETVVDKQWEEIGFHRPLAGILFNLVFIITAAGFGILFTVWFIPNIVYPFPEAMGFEDLVMQMFAVYFTLLDLGIGNSIQRFVAEENVKSPKTALQYVQFFIWYQMFSGLIQVTVIGIWALVYTPASAIAYTAWFILIYSTIQYPGMLGVFRGTLEAYQRFDRSNILGFIQTQVFENIIRIVLILIGRWWGSLNPAIGELMGAAMGSLLGRYLKDFVTAIIAAHWVAPIIRTIDPSYRVRDLFFVGFDRNTLKKCTSFGIRAMLPGLVSPIANFLAVILMLDLLPNYSTILGIYLMGEMLAHLVCTFSFPGMASIYSEAYLNGKYRLTEYYINSTNRWTSVLVLFMVGLVLGGAPLIGIVAGERFSLVTPIIQNFLIFKFILTLAAIPESVFNGVGKPELNIVLTICEQVTRIGVLWFMLAILEASWMALVYSVGFGLVVKYIVGNILIRTNVMKLHLNIWQTFIAPLIAAAVEALYVWLAMTFIFPPLTQAIGEIPAAVLLLVIGIFTGPFLIFFPVLALAGGRDDNSLRVLKKAMSMAGPSTKIVQFLYRTSMAVCKISPLHNRFSINEEGIQEEIADLMRIRQEKIRKPE